MFAGDMKFLQKKVQSSSSWWAPYGSCQTKLTVTQKWRWEVFDVPRPAVKLPYIDNDGQHEFNNKNEIKGSLMTHD